MEEKNAAGAVVKTYTIGDDVITQASSTSIEHLLYDGHGSTRQLVDSSENVTATYSYDAYGNLLGGNPGTPQNPGSPATNLLYAGEQFDTNLQMYYNRARYYDPAVGRFNRMDDFAGSSHDPQSLHKYLYSHANPINNIDPSGLLILSLVIKYAVYAALIAAIMPHAIRALSAAKQLIELTGLTNLVRSLANRGVIQFEVAESIRSEAFDTFTDILGTIGESLVMIAREVAVFYGYNMLFAAVTQAAMGGIKVGVNLARNAKIITKVGGEAIENHHLVFKCAVKEGIKNERTWRLTKSLHTARGTGLHSRIWKSERFSKLLPRRGMPMAKVIRSMGKQKWLDEMGECYKWLEESYRGDYDGIYKAYLKAVKDIAGTSGLI